MQVDLVLSSSEVLEEILTHFNQIKMFSKKFQKTIAGGLGALVSRGA